jgi:hypothetical protein
MIDMILDKILVFLILASASSIFKTEPTKNTSAMITTIKTTTATTFRK